MSDASKPSAQEIRRLRMLHPEMRERDFARIHKISEADLVAAHVGYGNLRLRPDVEAFLGNAASLGEVLCLTRNESVVHEKIGPFETTRYSPHASIALGEQIDLRIFPRHWAHAFAVEKTDKEGAVRHSFQFFDAAGDAVMKVHARPATRLESFAALVEKLKADEQTDAIETVTLDDREIDETAAPAGIEELRAAWQGLTDTHQFPPMLKRLNLTRHQALSRIDRDYAWPLPANAVATLLHAAAGARLPIMVFVSNRGCIQIHSGPIEKVQAMGPWINVMDETFHMHLRADQIAEAWAVRKPTRDGHVTSIEAFDANNKLIVQFFGKRQEGLDERLQWRSLVESLPRANQSTAA